MRIWKHKKYPKRVYVGSYKWVKLKRKKERQFVLTSSSHIVVFESWNAAKALGWEISK